MANRFAVYEPNSSPKKPSNKSKRLAIFNKRSREGCSRRCARGLSKIELTASPKKAIATSVKTVNKGAIDTNKQPKINIASIKKNQLKICNSATTTVKTVNRKQIK